MRNHTQNILVFFPIKYIFFRLTLKWKFFLYLIHFNNLVLRSTEKHFREKKIMKPTDYFAIEMLIIIMRCNLVLVLRIICLFTACIL